MNDEELRDYLKRFCFGREHLICSRDLVRQKNLRESDLRKKVNRLRRKAVPIASSREGYFYASNAAELYSTIRQLKEMRAGLDAAICGLEQAMGTALRRRRLTFFRRSLSRRFFCRTRSRLQMRCSRPKQKRFR